ncbi:MAG TPA: TraR/DksA C4-type zinc finger protein [Gaiellaceae bacterium]|nr:TraR/DksA C4-type zinc finger protein [Gaiellaceae bacterium]
MDATRARELLAAERRRLESLLRDRRSGDTPAELEELSPTDDADLGTETFQAELDEGQADDLREQVEAVGRAERRLEEGTFGVSVESGEPIPDERLEALPAAERTAEEQARYEGHVV